MELLDNLIKKRICIYFFELSSMAVHIVILLFFLFVHIFMFYFCMDIVFGLFSYIFLQHLGRSPFPIFFACNLWKPVICRAGYSVLGQTWSVQQLSVTLVE